VLDDIVINDYHFVEFGLQFVFHVFSFGNMS
jgi:hypothetical protein